MSTPTFTRVTFVPGGPPAINATNLNDIESFLDALQTYLTPTGMVGWTAASSAPTGWLLCDGSAVSRTTYAGLFSAIGTTFGTGDGSTTFNVPDLRETGVVGVGTRGSGVTAHDTYTLGQFKDDQYQGVVYPLPAAAGGAVNPGFVHFVANGSSSADTNGILWNTRAAVSDGTNGTPRTGTTTHGKQLGLNGIIKT